MDKLPHRDPHLWEALEACRPGSDDLSDPGMADLAAEMAASPELKAAHERLQNLDRAMAEAFQDVPVPEGLADRILARLQAAQGENATDEASPQKETAIPAVEAVLAASGAPARVSRRWWFALAGGVGLAASLLLVLFLVRMLHAPLRIPKEQLLTEAINSLNRDWKDGIWGTGQRWAPEVSEPAGYPFSSALPSSYHVAKWRRVSGFLDQEVVAYDLQDSQGITATLYVVQTRMPGLPDAPPSTPYSTAGCSAGAWQEGSLLYVLVVAGDEQRYEQFLRSVMSGPVT